MKFILFLLVFLLTGCQQQPITTSEFVFDTIITIQINDSSNEALLDEAIQLCITYENLFSNTIESSEISQINNADGSPVLVSDETITLLKEAIYYSELSNGIFDITIAPLVSLWDLNNLDTIPSEEEINALLPYVDYNSIVIDGNYVTLLDPNASLDVGAIAKGYVADKVKAYLLEQGVTSAIINLGGNVLCIGKNTDNTPFIIGIQDPSSSTSSTIGYVEANDIAIVTSGSYQRYQEIDGVIYHHILNPYTGYPIDSDIISVSVLCESSVMADSLSTICFSLGLEEAILLIEQLDDVEAIFITIDNEIITTKKSLLNN